MPTYEYECAACGHRFDEFQSMKDEPLTKCPECKKKKLQRLFGTGAALIFKGAGFYQTDYRSDSYKAAAKADSEKAPASGEKAGGDSGAKSGGEGKADKPAKGPTPEGGAKKGDASRKG